MVDSTCVVGLRNFILYKLYLPPIETTKLDTLNPFGRVILSATIKPIFNETLFIVSKIINYDRIYVKLTVVPTNPTIPDQLAI